MRNIIRYFLCGLSPALIVFGLFFNSERVLMKLDPEELSGFRDFAAGSDGKTALPDWFPSGIVPETALIENTTIGGLTLVLPENILAFTYSGEKPVDCPT